MENKKDFQDLGYVNGWKETPEIVKKCMELKHEVWSDTIGNCLTAVVCKECGYQYKIDSSD